jgi:proline racemase
MRLSRMITVVGAHAEGELNEVITGGVLNVPGETMFEKARWLETQGDALRAFLLHEPRGKVTQCTNLVLPSNNPEAAAGYVIIESASYPPMSGSNTICTVTVLLETGMIPMVEPLTTLTLEAPAGLIKVEAECRDGKVLSVKFRNLPSFVLHRDAMLEIEGHGTARVDVAYGGMLYVLAEAQDFGFDIVPDEAADLCEIGEKVKKAAAEQLTAVHPENDQIHTVNQTLWAGPIRRENGVVTARNGVIVSPGRLDRSPCGTGTCARVALLHAQGQIGVGERFVHESIIGTKFSAQIFETGTVGHIPSVSVAVSGQAWITAFHQYVLDPTDPFPTGYTLSDTWRREPKSQHN